MYGIRNGAIHAARSKDIIFEQVEEEIESRLVIAGIGQTGGSHGNPQALHALDHGGRPPEAAVTEVNGLKPRPSRRQTFGTRDAAARTVPADNPQRPRRGRGDRAGGGQKQSCQNRDKTPQIQNRRSKMVMTSPG